MPAGARAQESPDEPVEYILSVRMPPSWTITESLFAYELNGKYYLPALELAQGFEFFTEGESANLFLKGFASKEENTFVLDGVRHEITVKGERKSIPEDAVLQSDLLATDDIYVQLEVLNEIWPVEMSMELAGLSIAVTPEEELSFIRRKEREEKQQLVASRKELASEAREPLPLRPNPYKLLGKPVIDYQGSYTYSNAEKELTGSNIFSGKQQIAKMVADYSANFGWIDSEIERPDNVRFRLSRKAVEEDYLLVPGVKNFEAGDVTIRQRDLISNTTGGRGVVISNDIRDSGNEFDTVTIEGIAPAGWDIELYNNDEIIEFGIVPEDGQYIFDDVLIGYGTNNIKLIFFGPQGQVREETRAYSAGGNMLSPGKFNYTVGAQDSDRPFILLDNDPRPSPRGMVQTAGAGYGISKWLTLFGNFTHIPYADGDHSYVTAGAAMSTPIGLTEIEAYNELGGGEAVSTSLITQLMGFRMNLRASLFNELESSEAGFGTNRKTLETEAQVNRNVKLFSIPLGLRLNVRHTERENNDKITLIDASETLALAGVRLSHTTRTTLDHGAHQTSTGALTATSRRGPWQLRGAFNYEIYPTSRLGSFTSELRYKVNERFQTALNFSQNFQTYVAGAGLQLGYDFGKVLASLDNNYEEERGWEFILRASTSLNPYQPGGGYGFDSDARRAYSPIHANVFIDKNADGVFNEGDEPVENAGLEIGGGKSKILTDEKGYMIDNAPKDKRVNVRVNKASLTDPYYVPASEGFSVVPHEGDMIEASFPIVETGAIEGTVFRTSNGRAVAGLTLQLVDATGEVLKITESAFDGYYTFEFVPPGVYAIKADPEHNVDLKDNSSQLTPTELFVYGHDLYIQDGAPKSKTPFGPYRPGEEPAPAADAAPAMIANDPEDFLSANEGALSNIDDDEPGPAPDVEEAPADDVDTEWLDEEEEFMPLDNAQPLDPADTYEVEGMLE